MAKLAGKTPLLRFFAAGLVVFSMVGFAYADVLTFSGSITQSISDGTGPAVNNPSLNAIKDGDPFAVTLNINGSITSPGTYTNFSGAIFSDTAVPAGETSFGPISLTINPDGSGLDNISMLGCLTTGSGCPFGNQLAANFAIPVADLNAQNVVANGIPGLTPLDLLEDDGTTDIQGMISGYSYTSSVPEPSTLSLLCLGVLFAGAGLLRRN